MRLLLILWLLLPFLRGQTQVNHPFSGGESLSYEVWYNWGFVWLNTASVRFQTDTVQFRGKACYLFDCQASTHLRYDWFFKVRDRYRAWVCRQSFEPLYFRRQVAEGSFQTDDQYFFDPDARQIKTIVNNPATPLRNQTWSPDRRVFDVLSAAYFVRTLPISQFQSGLKIPVPVLLDNGIFDFSVRFRGKETITLPDQRTLACLKFTTVPSKGTIFGEGQEISVWVTDDSRHIPVYAEAGILVGHIRAYLKGF